LNRVRVVEGIGISSRRVRLQQHSKVVHERGGDFLGLVVQKFGGTSVATAAKIKKAARRAINTMNQGHQVVVVVSARGHRTDELIKLAGKIHSSPPARELDMLMATGEQESIALLAMAIHQLGREAVSLTGGQMGIVTDSIHGKARIREISTSRIRQILDEGRIAIVAGFQGVDQDQNITTLGRGGSDTTAVAIAAALGADVCEIYTDVDGVYTTDPRLVSNARKVDQISYDEMLELASVGAGVMHSRSIEFAKKFGTVIHVRHAGKNIEGTFIRPEHPSMEHIVVRGCALQRDEARITLEGVPDVPGVVYKIFSRIAAARIVVDMIVQNASIDGKTEVSFTVAKSDLAGTLAVTKEVAQAIGAEQVQHSTGLSKVSVVGLGMRVHSGVAERMFRALAGAGVNIRMITTSDIKISALVAENDSVQALQAIHKEFGLDQPLIEHREGIEFQPKHELLQPKAVSPDRLQEIARNLPTMEDILVGAIDHDDNQARVTLQSVPDHAGVASQIFAAVAKAGIAVDVIVQNIGSDGKTVLSFTVLKSDLSSAEETARQIMSELGGGQVTSDDSMTKISVRGVGMRTHTGVAARMFEALAGANVNIQVITTSELHITVVIESNDKDPALSALRSTFSVE
jgi:aspartate kinase